MGKSIKKNYMYNLMYEIVALIIPLITTPYISRVLDATTIGDYNYTASIVSYFGILAVTGTRNYGQREIATKQNDPYGRSVVFWEVFLFRAFCTLMVTGVYFVFLNYFLPQYKLLFLIQALTLIAWIFDVSWYFKGTENFKITAIRNTAIKVVGTLLIFALVKCRADLWKYTLILSAATLLGNMTMLPYLRREILRPAMGDIHIFRNLPENMSLFIPVIAVQVYTVMDKTMLGALCNTTEVGYYSQADKIIRLCLTVVASFVSVMMPRISLLFDQNNKEGIALYYRKTVEFTLFMAMPIAFGCASVANVFVPVYYGDGYAPVVMLLGVMSVLFIVIGLGQVHGTFFVAMRLQKYYSIAVCCAAVVNAILNYVTIVCFGLGALGTAIATVMAEVVCTAIQMVVVRKRLPLNEIWRPFLRYFGASLIMAAAVCAVKGLAEPSWLLLVLMVLTGVGVYGLVLLLQKDELLLQALRGLKRRNENP